jgi:formate dehydrogenase subunit gamma
LTDVSTTGPDRVTRHLAVDRAYHWIMAGSVLTLLVTSLLPILGIKFDWIVIHWVAGVVLTCAVAFHILRALIWQDRGAMWIGRLDFRRAIQSIRWVLRRTRQPADLPGKYPLLQKLYHHGVALAVLATIVTGGLMMVKVDTPFWVRDPYWLTSQSWGVIYVVHGLGTLFVLALVMVHIYFAFRPEKLWITRSMVLGWIGRGEYLANHDPALWPEPDEDPGRTTETET